MIDVSLKNKVLCIPVLVKDKKFDNVGVNQGDYVSVYTKGKQGYTKSTMKTPKDTTLHIIKRGLDINIFNQEGDTAHLVQINVEDKETVKPKV